MFSHYYSSKLIVSSNGSIHRTKFGTVEQLEVIFPVLPAEVWNACKFVVITKCEFTYAYIQNNAIYNIT